MDLKRKYERLQRRFERIELLLEIIHDEILKETDFCDDARKDLEGRSFHDEGRTICDLCEINKQICNFSPRRKNEAISKKFVYQIDRARTYMKEIFKIIEDEKCRILEKKQGK